MHIAETHGCRTPSSYMFVSKDGLCGLHQLYRSNGLVSRHNTASHKAAKAYAGLYLRPLDSHKLMCLVCQHVAVLDKVAQHQGCAASSTSFAVDIGRLTTACVLCIPIKQLPLSRTSVQELQLLVQKQVGLLTPVVQLQCRGGKPLARGDVAAETATHRE